MHLYDDGPLRLLELHAKLLWRREQQPSDSHETISPGCFTPQMVPGGRSVLQRLPVQTFVARACHRGLERTGNCELEQRQREQDGRYGVQEESHQVAGEVVSP